MERQSGECGEAKEKKIVIPPSEVFEIRKSKNYHIFLAFESIQHNFYHLYLQTSYCFDGVNNSGGRVYIITRISMIFST